MVGASQGQGGYEWPSRPPPGYTPTEASYQSHGENGPVPDHVVPDEPQLPVITSNDTVIAVMGITGAGKSTFISHFAETARVGHDLESCTYEVGIHQATIAGQKCFLIDTPGFDDTHRSDTDILREVADWLNRSYQARVKLAGIVYLHRIVDNRMGGAAMKNLRMFKRLCGDEGLPCVVLATTMWGLVTPEEGQRREHDLMTSPQFWAGMVEKGSRVLRQDNGATSALRIMQHVLAQRRRITLEIQREMADGKKLDETGAGREVQADMEALKKKYEAEMLKLREEMEEAQRMHDIQAQEEIREMRAELEAKLQKDAEDRERMRVNMEQLQQQRSEELRLQQQAAHEREMEFQKTMFQTQAQLEAARTKNDSDMRMMELKMQLAIRENENARWEAAEAERKSKECCVM